MKIKLLVVAITIIILTILSIVGFFVYQQITKPVPSTIDENQQAAGENKEFVTEPEIKKETRLIKDDFEITLPPGWQEATAPPEGILAMAIDAEEDISGGLFQKLDFRTNFSVKSDDITKYASVSSFEEYVSSVRTSLIQAVPSIVFVKEEKKPINSVKAIFLECSSTQEDADFKTLLVFVQGNDDIVYAISFNTFQSSWENYQSVFEQIAATFKLKYKI